MKTMSFEQMEHVNAGFSWGSFMCNSAAGGIGAIYGSVLAGAVGGPVGMVAGGVFGVVWSAGLSTLIC